MLDCQITNYHGVDTQQLQIVSKPSEPTIAFLHWGDLFEEILPILIVAQEGLIPQTPRTFHSQTQMGNPSAPKDIASLIAFLSMEIKMAITTLLQSCLNLWRDPSDWMNGLLDQ